MARKKRSDSRINYFHIYARSNNRISFGISEKEAWYIFSIYLYFLNKAYGVQIFAFCMMPNHFHLLCQFPEGNHSSSMRYFMTETAKRVNQLRGSMNHVYGGRYGSTEIKISDHFLMTYKYILQNPMRSGLTRNLLTYPYTSFSGLMGSNSLLIPLANLEDAPCGEWFSNYRKQLHWLYEIPSEQDIDLVRKALKKREFKIPKERGTNRERVINI